MVPKEPQDLLEEPEEPAALPVLPEVQVAMAESEPVAAAEPLETSQEGTAASAAAVANPEGQ